jgi:hypothetical protein
MVLVKQQVPQLQLVQLQRAQPVLPLQGRQEQPELEQVLAVPLLVAQLSSAYRSQSER